MKNLIYSALIVSQLLALGCGGSSSSNNNNSGGIAAVNTAGFVGQQTGDADDEVDAALQAQAEAAFALGDRDEPLDF